MEHGKRRLKEHSEDCQHAQDAKARLRAALQRHAYGAFRHTMHVIVPCVENQKGTGKEHRDAQQHDQCPSKLAPFHTSPLLYNIGFRHDHYITSKNGLKRFKWIKCKQTVN